MRVIIFTKTKWDVLGDGKNLVRLLFSDCISNIYILILL